MNEKPKKPEKSKKPKKSHKIDKKTKSTIIFIVIAIVLIIVTIIIANVSSSNKTYKYIADYGEIKTSVILDTSKFEATFTVNVQGNKVSQVCTYQSLSESESSDSNYTINGQYDLFLNEDETARMIVDENELTIIYDDGTSVKYIKG